MEYSIIAINFMSVGTISQSNSLTGSIPDNLDKQYGCPFIRMGRYRLFAFKNLNHANLH